MDAWREFVRGKRGKHDVQEFNLHLMDNILSLHHALRNHTYIHGAYAAFNISDPKPRNIHKARVRDRLLHHALHRLLYPFFDKTFIADSFSCRLNKGKHRAMNRFRGYAYGVSRNHTRTCWVLKCDIKRFFANVDHAALGSILREYIPDNHILWLLNRVIDSFSSTRVGVGLPLGNLTSQLLVNVYMNKFDQFVKHKLHARYYIRYADDFVIFSEDKEHLEKLISQIGKFLRDQLKLVLHPQKVFIKTLASGVDFLGWIHFSDCRTLRTTTRRRMIQRVSSHPTAGTVDSYSGLLQHGNAYALQKQVSTLFDMVPRV